MRVYLHYEECWEIKRQWTNATENGRYRLQHALVGWQAKRFYWASSGEFVTIEWEIDPFPSEVCPQCHLRVPAGDVETRVYYREEVSYVCRLRLAMCGLCRSEHCADYWEWPRGDDGRWLPSRECEAVSA